jgi:hypothetical protein
MELVQLLETVDQRISASQERVNRLRALVAEHADWVEMARVLRLSEECLEDLRLHRLMVQSLIDRPPAPGKSSPQCPINSLEVQSRPRSLDK